MSFVHGSTPARQRARFAVGALVARARGVAIGHACSIDARVEVIAARNVVIHDHVEILRGTTLDGRARAGPALELGARSRLKENVWLACYGGNIHIGEEAFIGRNVVMQGHGGIHVGRFCGFGPNVVILSHHQLMVPNVPYHRQGYVAAPVWIGDDCQIGAGSVVVGGVRIGSRTMIGASSVVTCDLEGGAVYAGSPARRIGDYDRPQPTDVKPLTHGDWE